MSNNITINFKKDNNNIYLEGLNDGGKDIEVNTDIPILNISVDGEYAKVGNFDNEINKILNKDTEKEKLEIEETDGPDIETDNIDNRQALVPTESGVGEGFIPNDNEVEKDISQKIITFITNKDINKNLIGEKLLSIEEPIKIFTEKVLDNIKNLSKNGNSTGTSESALIVYEPNTLIENKYEIVNTIKDEFENNVFTVNQDLKNIFGENSRAGLYDEIFNIIITDFEKVNSGETESNKNVEGCSDEFTTTKKAIEERFKELIKKDFKQVNKETDCKNVDKKEYRDYSLKVSQDKNPDCIAAKETQQNLNNIKSVCLDAVGNGDENAVGNGDENAIGNGDGHAIGNGNLITEGTEGTEGGKKNRTKKRTKAGKKKSKKVRFVMTKKGRKNKKNRTRR